jgi:hypothetical protein
MGYNVDSHVCSREIFSLHAGFHRTTCVYVGPTILKVNTPSKNKKKCITEELRYKGG